MPLQLPPPDPLWREVTQLVRRICLLRERGDDVTAAHLEAGDLPAALAFYRATHPGTDLAPRLATTFAAESDRVATASLVAELLNAPITAFAPVAASPAAVVATLPSLAPFEPPRSSPSAASLPPPGPRAVPGTDIAGFIDQMLALDEAAAPPPQRRAS